MINVCNGQINRGDPVDLFKLKLHVFATGPIGMVSALVQTNPEAMNAELADQDLEAVDELDKELREEGINVRLLFYTISCKLFILPYCHDSGQNMI